MSDDLEDRVEELEDKVNDLTEIVDQLVVNLDKLVNEEIRKKWEEGDNQSSQ